jgi:hypothetical protein
MSEVLGPHPLYGVPLRELREDGIDTVAKTAQIGALSWDRISFLGGIRSQKFYAHPRQLLLGVGRVVVAVPDEKAGGALGEVGHYGEFVGVGRSYAQASDDTRPSYPHVYPKAVEGLPEERIFAKGGLAAEARAAIGAGEKTCRQGHRIADGEGGIMRNEREEILPEALLGLPEVGRLPGGGSPMYLTQSGEPFTVVTAEKEVDSLVGVEPQELPDDLDGEDLGVGELGGGSALTDTPSFEPIIYQTEDSDDQGAKIHERKTSFCSRWIGAPPRVGRSSLWLKSSKKPAHGVN